MAGSHSRPQKGHGRGEYRARGSRNDRGRGRNNTHGRNGGDVPSQRERQPLSVDDQDYLTWRRGIPFQKPGQSLFRERMTRSKLSTFMQTALRLIELRNDGIRQQVITELASEGGMLRVAELFEIDLTAPTAEDNYIVFEQMVLPFLQTITHRDVLSSLLLEKPLGDLYVYFYGREGRRAIALFESYSNLLKHMMHRNTTASIHTFASTVLTSLLQVLKSNQKASLMPEFLPIVDLLQECLDGESDMFTGTLLQQAASRDMRVIRRLLEHGQSIEPIPSSMADDRQAKFIFELSQDGPGSLSSAGPRHDNDSNSITHVRILPTADEIRSSRSEY